MFGVGKRPAAVRSLIGRFVGDAAFVAGRASLWHRYQTHRHRIASLRLGNLRDRVVGNLIAAISKIDRASRAGDWLVGGAVLQPGRYVLDYRDGALTNLRRQR